MDTFCKAETGIAIFYTTTADSCFKTMRNIKLYQIKEI